MYTVRPFASVRNRPGAPDDVANPELVATVAVSGVV
jgi:hypothetical protein